MRIDRPIGEPPRQTPRAERSRAGAPTEAPASTAQSAASSRSAPTAATQSIGAEARAASAPVQRALAGAQDGITFARVAEEALAGVESVLGTIAGPGDVAGALARIDEITGGAVFGGAAVLADHGAQPVRFLRTAAGDEAIVGENLTVDPTGAEGVIHVDLLGAPPADFPAIASRAAEQVAAARARLAELRETLALDAMASVTELTGGRPSAEEVDRLVADAIAALGRDGAAAAVAQANLPSGTPQRVLGG